jgi:PTH1 family peptidyl-tRNA hydrolase
MSNKYLIVGLGNPGRKYATTRHNAGFWVVGELARRHDLSKFTEERKALTADGLIGGKRVLLAMPQTYMNLSGESVRALVDFYKIDLDKLIVIYDDMDLSVGTLRLRRGGGHGGQNGMRNIILHLGTKEFARVRFGIGKPPGRMKAKDYVLQDFYGDEAILAQQVVEKAADAVETWLATDIETAMQRFNGDVTEGTKNTKEKPDHEEQLELAERAHELHPNDPRPLEQMAALYKKLRRLDEAARAHLLLGEIHRAQGDDKQWLYQWELAVKVRPALVDVREEIALAYEEQENPKRAVQTWIALAQYQHKQGDNESAIASLEEALRINDQHSKARDLLRTYSGALTEPLEE